MSIIEWYDDFYDDEIKVILPAHQIPDSSRVSKVKGKKEYVLKKSYKIYGEGGMEINPPEDCLFLISETSANIINSNTDLIWITYPNILYNFLEIIIESEWTK